MDIFARFSYVSLFFLYPRLVAPSFSFPLSPLPSDIDSRRSFRPRARCRTSVSHLFAAFNFPLCFACVSGQRCPISVLFCLDSCFLVSRRPIRFQLSPSVTADCEPMRSVSSVVSLPSRLDHHAASPAVVRPQQ